MNKLSLIKEFNELNDNFIGHPIIHKDYLDHHKMLCNDLYSKVHELKTCCKNHSLSLGDDSFNEFFIKFENTTKPLFDSGYSSTGKIPNELLSSLFELEDYIENFKLRESDYKFNDLEKSIKNIFLILPKFRKLKDVKNS